MVVVFSLITMSLPTRRKVTRLALSLKLLGKRMAWLLPDMNTAALAVKDVINIPFNGYTNCILRLISLQATHSTNVTTRMSEKIRSLCRDATMC